MKFKLNQIVEVAFSASKSISPEQMNALETSTETLVKWGNISVLGTSNPLRNPGRNHEEVKA
jgi:hypothetical protein